ncbi:MAG: hypothetical protein Hyperionvirus1_155 [Hyperionvirus sp.]|uniref:Uncharacterized protein n=1 Tax=Hyperionvirus sp. TaxID=2487770 RepID=A0A3G5A5Q6_9VIRU|nr:MAG: hypothetical protein Hyperionvirus1_155 [Hyperionvirus sp.]
MDESDLIWGVVGIEGELSRCVPVDSAFEIILGMVWRSPNFGEVMIAECAEKNTGQGVVPIAAILAEEDDFHA